MNFYTFHFAKKAITSIFSGIGIDVNANLKKSEAILYFKKLNFILKGKAKGNLRLKCFHNGIIFIKSKCREFNRNKKAPPKQGLEFFGL